MEKMAILLIVLMMVSVGFLSGCTSSTYKARQSIKQIHLSSDGSKLLSTSGGDFRMSLHRDVYDYMIWNTTSGKVVWSETLNKYFNASISPDGKYFINLGNNSIVSIESGETIAHISGIYCDWTGNGKYFVTVNDNFINIWNAKNFSKLKMIPINESIRKITLSPDGSRIAVEIHTQKQNSLKVIDVSSEKSISLFNYSEYSVYNIPYNIEYLSWSKNGDELQMVKREYYTSDYKLIIWNISDNNILYNLSLAANGLLDVEFGKYIICDDEKSKLIFYNLTGAETILNINSNILYHFELSYDDSIMAIGGGGKLGSNGIIEIRNATTGLLINTLETPVYEFDRPIPGFEIIVVFCAIALVLFWKRKRLKL